jgi:hypothetical protein
MAFAPVMGQLLRFLSARDCSVIPLKITLFLGDEGNGFLQMDL